MKQEQLSFLQRQRLHYQPKLPLLLHKLRQLKWVPAARSHVGERTIDPKVAAFFPTTADQPLLELAEEHKLARTPKRVAILFSGGQAPGGHNVVTGLYDGLVALHQESRLFGFQGGAAGLLKQQFMPLSRDQLQLYRNSGGFDLLGSGRDKIETPEQFQAVERTVDQLQLDGLVIVGGDDSNTNSALLAEYFRSKGARLAIVGVPKTIDGDLKSKLLEASFGFDTAAKTYAALVGDLCRDALSSRKYYHIIKLMGRSASHIALECALQTHPNALLIGEELWSKGKRWSEVVSELADLIGKRAAQGKQHGVILLPEGIVEFIPEFRLLISELNEFLSQNELPEELVAEARLEQVKAHLSIESAKSFSSLPPSIAQQLLMGRDPHGNVQLAKIESERLLAEALQQELERRGDPSVQFNPQLHYFGYEGRSCFPSNFDCQYCYGLGHLAALLIQGAHTGYLCTIGRLCDPVEQWECRALPLVQLMNLERRKGKEKPVVAKALVDLEGTPFKTYVDMREQWALEDNYRFPGPIQFGGESEVTDVTTITLQLEHHPERWLSQLPSFS